MSGFGRSYLQRRYGLESRSIVGGDLGSSAEFRVPSLAAEKKHGLWTHEAGHGRRHSSGIVQSEENLLALQSLS